MVVLKYLLPAVAAANYAFAADCGGDGTIKISSQGDADKYSSCKTLKGDVKISSDASNTISLNGVQEIEGSLIANNATDLSGIQAPQLQSIGDKFELKSLTTLSTLSMDSLTSVGSIDWEALPAIQTLDFSKGISKADKVEITNTGLTNLDGISLSNVGNLDITENRYMKSVNLNGLTKSTGLINFAGNQDNLEVELPKLISGSNMTFRNVSTVSCPSLANLTGQLGFWGDGFTSFSAPNLTESSDLTFIGNKNAKNISMPKLETVDGGFHISKNDKLKSISFPELQQVNGAVDFSGKFDEASLPKLELVRGGFNMQSTGNFGCSQFNKYNQDKVIRGKYTCKGEKKNPKTKGGASGTDSSGGSGTTNSGSGGSSSSTSSGAAVPDTIVNVPTMSMAAFFGFLLQFAM